jgi:hypothetical protein
MGAPALQKIEAARTRASRRGTGRMLLTPKQTGERIKKHEQTLANWRCKGIGPEYLKLGGAVYYDSNTLDQWILSCARSCTRTPARPDNVA